MTNAERFLSNYKKYRYGVTEISDDEKERELDAKSRFLRFYDTEIAARRASQWFSSADSIIEDVNRLYRDKEPTDELLYDPEAYSEAIDRLLGSAGATRSFLETKRVDTDFDYDTFSSELDNIISTLERIKAGTYGLATYKVGDKAFTKKELEDLIKESEAEAESKKPFTFNKHLSISGIPGLSELAGYLLDKEGMQEYQQALNKVAEYKGILAGIENYQKLKPYEDFKQLPEFEEKSKYYPKYSEDYDYKFVNDPDARSAARIIAAGSGGQVDEKIDLYDYLTDDEIKVYNYIYSTQGKEEAQKYLDTLNLTQRRTADYQERLAKFAKEGPVQAAAASLYSIPLGLIGGIAGTVGNVGSYISGQGIDQYARYNLYTNVAQAAREAVSEDMGPVGRFLYGAGMSTADFLTALGLTGGSSALTLGILGSNAASSTIIDAKNRGLDDTRALLLGAIAGAAEVITEKVSIEALLDAAGFGKNAVQYLLKNIVAEGSEEIASSFINLVADVLISKDKSEWQQTIRGYMEQGDDAKTAFWKAVRDQAVQIGLEGLGGALSGGVLAGGGIALNTAINYADTTSLGREILAEPARLTEIIDMAKNFEPTTDAYQLALQVAEEQQRGRKVSAREAGRMAQAVARQYTENLSKAAETEQKAEPAEMAQEAPVNPKAEQEAEEISIETQIATQERSGKTIGAAAKIGDTDVIVQGISSVDRDNVYVKLDNGVANLNDVTFANSQIAKVYQAASNFEDSGAKAFVAGYDGSIPVDVYTTAARQYYTAGLVGNPIESVSQDGYGRFITDFATRQSLYQAGINDAQAKTAAEVAALKKAVKPEKGKYGVRYENTVELTEAQKQQAEVLNIIGRVYKVRFVLKDSVGKGLAAYYSPRGGGEVVIGIDEVENALLKYAGHEMTHHIQNWSSEKYRAFRDFVVNSLIKQMGQNEFDALVNRTILAYSTEANQKLTQQEAIDEIVANAAYTFLTDPEFIQEIVEKDKSLAQKIIDFLKELIAKLENALKQIEPKSVEAQLLAEDIDTLKEARRLWSEALADAKKAVEVASARESKAKVVKTKARFSLNNDIPITYDTLISKPDITIVNLGDVPANIKNKNIDRKKIVESALQNAAKIGKVTKNGNIYVHVKDTDTDVIISKSAIRHGLDRRLYLQAHPILHIGEILSNSLLINKLYPRKNAVDSYILIGAARGSDGTFYLISSIVNRFTNEVESVDVLQSANIKREPGAVRPELQEDTSLQSLTGSTLSVSKLLDFVKEYFPDILPASVLEHYGMVRPETESGKNVRYSLKDSEGRTLTPEQAEYFRYSKVRDENGNLKVVYHHTNEDFNIFDITKARQTQDIPGFFFSDDPDEWRDMGRRVVKAYLNIKNPYTGDYSTYAGIKGGSTDTAYQEIRQALIRDGYDGIITRDGYTTEYIAFYPEQIKSINNTSPTNNPDIRFSLKDIGNVDYERLIKENNKWRELAQSLQQQVELLKAEMKPSDRKRTNPKGIERLANKLLKKYNSKYDKSMLVHNLTTLFDWIANSKQISGEEIMSVAADVAMRVLEKSEVLNNEMYKQYKPLRDYLRTIGISLSDTQKKEVAIYYGSYEEFRRKNFGRIRLKEGGIPLDTIFKELAEMYPEFFDADIPETEQPLALVSALEAIQPQYENPFGMSMEDTAAAMAAEIYDEYFNIPEVKTFADKKAREFNLMKAHYLNKIAEIRQEAKERYNQRLTEVKKKNIEKIQQLTQKYNAASAAEKAKYKEQIQKLRSDKNARIAAISEMYKEKLKSQRETMRERQGIRKLMNSIRSKANDLGQKLLKPTDTKHIPEGLRVAIADLCRMLNFETGRTTPEGEITKVTERLRELNAQYEKIYHDESSQLQGAYDEDIKVKLDQLAEITKNRRINELSRAELEEVKDIVDYFYHLVSLENKMFNKKLKEQRDVYGSRALNELRQHEPARRIKKLAENKLYTSFVEMVRTGVMKPYYFFNRIGGVLQELYTEIRNGEDNYIKKIKEAREFSAETMKKYHYWDWASDERTEFVTERGESIQLTTNEKLYLYMLYQREQGQAHINMGGIVLENAVKEVKGKGGITYVVNETEPIQFTYQDILRLGETLTDEQIEFAKEMVKYLSTVCAGWGNEVSMTLYGYKKFKEPNYIPINSVKNYLFKKVGLPRDARLKHRGWTKTTVPGANNPVVVSDFLKVWAQHVNDMALYNSFVVPIEDFTQIWNYRTRVAEDFKSESVRGLIEKAFGKEANKYIEGLLQDLNGGVKPPRGEGLYNQLLSLFKKSAVYASLSVAIQQPSSIARAFAVVDPKYFAKTIFQQRDYEELKKYSAQAVLKEWGFFDTHLGRDITDLLIQPEPESVTERIKRLMKDKEYRKNYLDEIFSWLPQKMDEITWTHIWNAVKAEIADKRPELKVGSQEFFEAAAERFKEVIDRTQVMDSVFQRAEIMRSPSAAMKTATLFMAEPLTSLNMLIDAGLEKNKGSRARIVSSVIASMVLNAALASLVYAMRDKDDDKTYGEKYKKAFIDELIESPLNLVPYARDIYSLIAGYTPIRPELEPFNELVYRIKRIWSDKYSPTQKVWGIIEAVAIFGKLPLKNIARDASAVYDTAVDILREMGVIEDPDDNPALAFEIAKKKYDINKRDKDGSLNSAVSAVFYDIAFAAKQKGDMATYEAVRRYMLNSGRKSSAFEQAMLNRAVEQLVGDEKKKIKGDLRIKEAAQAQIYGDYPKRLRIINELIAEGHDKKVVLKAVEEVVSQLYKENAPAPEEFIEAYKTGDRSKWYPLYRRLKLAGWSDKDILALVRD